LHLLYGIIQNHGGIIKVSSKLGAGTTFDIYLPASERAIHRELAPSPEPVIKEQRPTSRGRRTKGSRYLRTVLAESRLFRVNGKKTAKKRWRPTKKNKANVAIVVIDMIMPGMNEGAFRSTQSDTTLLESATCQLVTV